MRESPSPKFSPRSKSPLKFNDAATSVIDRLYAKLMACFSHGALRHGHYFLEERCLSDDDARVRASKCQAYSPNQVSLLARAPELLTPVFALLQREQTSGTHYARPCSSICRVFQPPRRSLPDELCAKFVASIRPPYYTEQTGNSGLLQPSSSGIFLLNVAIPDSQPQLSIIRACDPPESTLSNLILQHRPARNARLAR